MSGISKTGLLVLAAVLCAATARAVDVSENVFDAGSAYFTGGTVGCEKRQVNGTNENITELQCGATGGPVTFPFMLPEDAGPNPAMKYDVGYTIDGVCSGGTNNGGRCKVSGDCPSGTCASQGAVRCYAQVKMVCYPDGADMNAPTGSADTYELPNMGNPGVGKVNTRTNTQLDVSPWNALTGTACDGTCRDTPCQIFFSFISTPNPASYCNLRKLRLQYNRF